MSDVHHCAICDGRVSDPSAWADLDDLPRLWFCPSHWPSSSCFEERDFRFVRAMTGRWLYLFDGKLYALGLPVEVTA